MEEVLSTIELSERLGLTPRQLRTRIEQGIIPDAKQRIGSARVWTEAEVAAAEKALAKFNAKGPRISEALARLAGETPMPSAAEILSGRSSPLIDAERLAKLLHLTLRQVYRATSSEGQARFGARLPYVKHGRRILFRTRDVLRWLDQVREYKAARTWAKQQVAE